LNSGERCLTAGFRVSATDLAALFTDTSSDSDLVVLRAATMLKSVADELLAEPLHASRRQSDIEHNSLYWNITGI
jgi:hypothetical protein